MNIKYTLMFLIGLTLAGIFDCGALVFLHFGASDICTGGGCDAVMSSSFSHVLGIPLSIFGLVYYFSLFTLSLRQRFFPRPHLMNWVFNLSSIGVLVSVYFVFLQAFIIGQWCPFCLISAGLSLGVFLVSLFQIRKSSAPLLSFENGKQEGVSVAFISLVVFSVFFGTHYYKGNTSSGSSYSRVAAVIDGNPITLREIDKELDLSFSKKKIDIYKKRLAILEKKLLTVEAQERGLSIGQLSKQIIQKEMTSISDRDIKTFYEKNKYKFPGKSLKELEADIKYTLTYAHTRQVILSFVSQMKKDHHFENHLPKDFYLTIKPNPLLESFIGPEKTKLVITLFYDYECIHCKKAFEKTLALQKQYSNDVSVQFRNMPISSHKGSHLKAISAICAQDQDIFINYSQKLFEDLKPSKTLDLIEIAAALGADEARFKSCLESENAADILDADIEETKRLSLTGTPSLFFNGEYMLGFPDEPVLNTLLNDLNISD